MVRNRLVTVVACLVSLVLLSPFALSGCNQRSGDMPAEVRAAREAALAHMRTQGFEAPDVDARWSEEETTPEGLLGANHYQCRSGDWLVTLIVPVVAPDATVYSVSVVNESNGTTWEGQVDAAGVVTDVNAPEPASPAFLGPQGARDAVIVHLSGQSGALLPEPLPLGLDWAEEDMNKEGLLGGASYRYTAGNWLITVSYPIVAPDSTIYNVVVEHASEAAGYRWEGEVNPQGEVVKGAAPEAARAACDSAWRYLIQEHGAQVTGESVVWSEENITPEGQVGSAAYRRTAGDMVMTVAYPITALEETVYRVSFDNTATGFHWEGDVDANGQVSEQYAPSSQTVAAIAWYGTVRTESGAAGTNDYLMLLPEGCGEVGLAGADEELETQIVALRDQTEPGNLAHFWGTVYCPQPDHGGCQLLVTRLRIDQAGPLPDPEPVEGWVGQIVSVPAGARSGGDDYLVLAGDFPVQYGLDAATEPIADQIQAVRDSGAAMSVWGELNIGVMDWNGAQIRVTRIETVE